MVLELKVPHGVDFAALIPLFPVFLAYALSFIYLAIYWNNHHHLFQIAQQVNGQILWANLHLLFWLSLVPLVTAWAGESHFATVPVFCYGAVLFFAAIAYFILTRTLITYHGNDSKLAVVLKDNFKDKVSLGIYAAAILLCFVNSLLACLLYVLVAILWLIPDRRIERSLSN
jgi:uncharacterized membrane protein